MSLLPILHKDRLTDLRCSVKSADQVGRDVVLSDVGCRAKVTKLQNGFRLIHLLEEKAIKKGNATRHKDLVLCCKVTLFMNFTRMLSGLMSA